MKDFSLIAELRAHSESVSFVKWTADQRQLISVAGDATCCIWNYYGPNANEKNAEENSKSKNDVKAIESGDNIAGEVRGEIQYPS